MKLVTAIIQSHQLDQVRAALIGAGFNAMTITSVRGSGVHKGTTAMYRGVVYEDEFSDCTKIEFAIASEKVKIAINTVKDSIGAENGVLWVQALEYFIQFNK
ncbi:P-II family nitrogen regulator [Acetobacteraceae bacterium]|nr:P-II family nitrogen regulator [Acetobacteraceae bacterium]